MGESHLEEEPEILWEAILPALEDLSKKYDMHQLLRHPSKPQNEFDITRLNTVSSAELGEMLGYFSAMFAYVNAQYSLLDGQLTAVRNNFEVSLNIETFKIESTYTDKRRPLKDSIEGIALSQNQNLSRMKMKQIELEAQVRVTKGFAASWETLYQAVSREVTRRGNESHL